MRRAGAGLSKRAGGRTPSLSTDPFPYLKWWAGNIIAVWDLRTGVQATGGFVDSIQDQSGNGNHAVAAGAVRPAYNAADVLFGDEPTLSGDGANDAIGLAAATWPGANFSGATGGSMVLVQCLTANVNGDVTASLGAGGAAMRSIESTAQRVNMSWAGATLISAALFVNAPHVHIGACTGGFGVRYLDGVQAPGGNVATGINLASPQPLFLCATNTPGNWSASKFAFAAFLNKNLTSADATQFTNWARTIWNTP